MPFRVTKDAIDKATYRWQARHNQRMTHVELARRAGITLASLNRLMSGDIIEPDLRKVSAIAKVLECDPRELFDAWLTPDNEETLKKSQFKVDRVEDEFKAKSIKPEFEGESREMLVEYVKKFKGWIIREQYTDKPDVILLKPGASSVDPSPDEVQYLAGVFAKAWRRQNSSDEVIMRRKR